MNEHPVKVFQVRMPAELYAELDELHRLDERSIHWELLRSLRFGLPLAKAETQRRIAADSPSP